MKNIIMTTIAAAGVATVSVAGSPDPIAPAVAPVATASADWGGFYLGATYGMRVGGDMVYDDGGLTVYDSLEPGSSYGAFAGYNVQRNNLVYGGEVAYSQVDVPGFGPIGFPLETFNYFVDGKARIGYAMNNVLIYGFAGYSFSNFEYEDGTNWDVSGLNYGAGVDLMVGGNMFVGAEYIIRNLSGETNSPTQIQTTNIQAFQLRAGWKF